MCVCLTGIPRYSRSACCKDMVKVVSAICARAKRVFPVFHAAHAHKTLQTYGFPVQSYGRYCRGHIFKLQL